MANKWSNFKIKNEIKIISPSTEENIIQNLNYVIHVNTVELNCLHERIPIYVLLSSLR